MGEQKVLVDQLCTGLFVRLDLKWSEHPFFFNSFKIKSAEQIRILQELGLREIIYIPEKSDCPPLAPHSSPRIDPHPRISAEPSMEKEKIDHLRREQMERVRRQRQRIQVCEKQYEETLGQVRKVMHGLSAGTKEAAQEADALVHGLVGSITANSETILHIMNIKSVDETIFYHTLNVAILALVAAKAYGTDPQELRLLGLGALFHDVGKQKLPKALLYKRGTLSPSEQKLIHLHPQYGAEMMAMVPDFPREALSIIRQHHETNDGKGYPEGLTAQGISFLSKVTAIADYYDNLCNRLDPLDSLTPHESLSHMYLKRQDKFDRALLSLFIGCLGVYPPGTVVQLTNGIIGMVVTINAGKPLQPTLLIYDPTVPKKEAIIFDLEAEPDIQIERSLRPSQLPTEVFNYLDPRHRVSYFFESKGDARSRKPLF
jgi:putative nucleotidyltransferase with HDIG domain